MLGLPQTFLRDAGIDISSFNSLPEDMQIEQLTLLMEHQHIRNQGGQGQGQGQQGNQGNRPN